jgi:DNA-binding response OmpR family regulator
MLFHLVTPSLEPNVTYSFLLPSESVSFNPAERRTLRMIAGMLEAMSRQEREQPTTNMPGSRFVFGNVDLDTVLRTVAVDGQSVSLSPREYDLLLALAMAGGNLVTSEELRQTVWQGAIDAGSRAIAQCVSELRRKVDPVEPRHIQLVRKYGYRLSGRWI